MTAARDGVVHAATVDDVWRSLRAVLDPELDEPITDLGFVRSIRIEDAWGGGPAATVRVHLRLPTSFCSPNFAYLMASDSKDVIAAIPHAHGYTDSRGILSARRAVVTRYETEPGFPEIDVDDVYLGNGVSELITMVPRPRRPGRQYAAGRSSMSRISASP